MEIKKNVVKSFNSLHHPAYYYDYEYYYYESIIELKYSELIEYSRMAGHTDMLHYVNGILTNKRSLVNDKLVDRYHYYEFLDKDFVMMSKFRYRKVFKTDKIKIIIHHLHNEDGPAMIVSMDGGQSHRSYFLHNKKLSEQQWLTKKNNLELFE